MNESRYVMPLDLPDELGCDLSDLCDGEMVCNAARDRRVVCKVYSRVDTLVGSFAGRVLYFDPATGSRFDVSVEEWGKWAGEQVWCLENPHGHAGGWQARSPFDNGVKSAAGEPALISYSVRLMLYPDDGYGYYGRVSYSLGSNAPYGSDSIEDVAVKCSDDEVREQVAAQVGITGDEISKIKVEWI